LLLRLCSVFRCFYFTFQSFNIHVIFVFICLVSLLCLAGVCWIDIPSSLYLKSENSCRHSLSTFQTSPLSHEMFSLSAVVLPFMMRFCVYLLEYVCSRGPLSPHFLTALLHLHFPSTKLPTNERCITLPHFAVACPLGAHRVTLITGATW